MLWRKQETEGTREDGRKELSNEKWAFKWKVKSQKTAEWQLCWELNGCGHWVWNISSWLCDKKASQDSCFARTHGRRGAETAVNGIPYLLTVRAFCAEKDCDLFSSCSLPSIKVKNRAKADPYVWQLLVPPRDASTPWSFEAPRGPPKSLFMWIENIYYAGFQTLTFFTVIK